jgi:6-pyruvoyltetrahydropterin/6-carboxytetrahydropterin synthase
LYRIFIDTHFAASHQLHGYDGACRALHGHTWKVRVEAKTDRINNIGISFDFKSLKNLIQKAIEPLDHHHINEIPPFDKENPTAENLASYIYQKVKEKLPKDIRMSEVTVWESASYAVTYSEDNLD